MNGNIGIAVNSPRGQRKCKPGSVCDGLAGLVGASAGVLGGGIMLLVDPGSGAVEAIGHFIEDENRMNVFNFCPNCGERLRFPANG